MIEGKTKIEVEVERKRKWTYSNPVPNKTARSKPYGEMPIKTQVKGK